MSYLRVATVRSQAIIGRAPLMHGTRSLGLAEATVEDGRGRLLGHASSRCVLFPVDPEILAARRLPEVHRAEVPNPYEREVEGAVHGAEFWDATPGLEAMEQFVEGALVPPCFRLFGLRGVEAREGAMTVAMPASPWFCNAFGVIYGGAIALLADATITMTAATTVPAATAFNTIDLKLYFLRPTVPADGELMARATLIHRGRTIAVVRCNITGPDGALVAEATGSVLILPGRHWERPVSVADELTDEAGRVLTTVLAIECAAAVRRKLQPLELNIRAGIYAGECEESGGKLVGIAVHIGARIAAAAADDEILVSSTVKDLVAGSAIDFADRGEHTLKGILEPWHLYAARGST